MAYPFVPFPMTLDDREGHSPNAGPIECNSTNIQHWRVPVPQLAHGPAVGAPS